jgi:DNA mismatch endonuclease (patch repair protein)
VTRADYPHPTSPAVSAQMKGNRRAGTRPEQAVRSALHARGLRFRKDFLLRAGDVRVKADVVFTRPRVVVMVDGCFWHCCPEHGRVPKPNAHYWPAKLERNRQRDARVNAALRADGWLVLRFWEHEVVEDLAAVADRVVAALRERAAARTLN